MLGKDFYCSWNANLNATIPSSLAPTLIDNIEWTPVGKIGGGIHPSSPSPSSKLQWFENFSVPQRDTGAISWWFSLHENRIRNVLGWFQSFSNASRIHINFQVVNAEQQQGPDIPQLNLTLQMHSLGGSLRVDESRQYFLEYYEVFTWRYAELRWKWNDPNGYTEFLVDGEVVINSADGNEWSRALALSLWQISFIHEKGLPRSTSVYADELTVWQSLSTAYASIGSYLYSQRAFAF